MFSKGNWKNTVLLMLVLSMILTVIGCGKTPTEKPAAAGATKPGFKLEKPVTMIVPFSAGGSSDLLARAVEKVWPKYSSQPLQVVNKPGGGGIEGARFVSRAKPDGYTIEMGLGSGHDLVMPHLEKMEYDPFRDLVPAARVSIHSVMIVVPENSPFKTIKDVVEWSKRENKPITAAVSTTAGAVDLTMRALGKRAGVNVIPVPHAGGSQAVTTILGGQTVIGGAFASEVIGHLKAKRLRPLAVAIPERDPATPDVPTLKEQGYDVSVWGSVKGIGLPKGTPPEITAFYSDLFKKITDDAEFKKIMQDMLQPINYMTAADYGIWMHKAYDETGVLINELGLAKKQ
jgi:tripartite-type tricarboxylate transporter receptor subunit TctC